MPREHDAIRLLTALRPQSAFEPNRALLERIVSTPPEPPRRRRPRRPLLAVAVLAVCGFALAALLPSGLESPLRRQGPDVLAGIARAATRLSAPDGIYHFTTTRTYLGRPAMGGEFWHTDGGTQTRAVFPNGAELAFDYPARKGAAYNAQRNRITVFTDPDYFAGRPVTLANPLGGDPNNISGLAALLASARRGDPRMHVEADTTVRGIPVHTLRIDYRLDGSTVFAVVYVDRRSFLPVRMIEGPNVIDYHGVERLPRTKTTDRLLELSPIPARRWSSRARSSTPARTRGDARSAPSSRRRWSLASRRSPRSSSGRAWESGGSAWG